MQKAINEMILFITDSDAHFSISKNNFKVLLKEWQIEKCTFFSQDFIDNFNLSLNSIEFLAADTMLIDLAEELEKLKNQNFAFNNYLKTRNNEDRIHTYLYVSFWNFVIKKHVLRIFTERILKASTENFTSLSYNIVDDYKLLSKDFSKYFPSISGSFVFRKNSKSTASIIKTKLKNLAYAAYYIVRKIVGYPKIRHQHKKKVLLFLYDIYSQHNVLTTFFEKLKTNSDLHLIIIHLTTSIEFEFSATPFYLNKSENITVLDYTIFRKPGFISHADFYQAMKNIHPSYALFKANDSLETIEKHYSWIGNVFDIIKPDICINVALLDVGRVMSDVARFNKVPSVNIEYGLFSDDSLYMESNSEFTARACIGEESVKIWKKRKDPTLSHPIIGFCKLDNFEAELMDKNSFFKKHEFNTAAQTIFFASTWSAGNKSYNEEKRKIVEELSILSAKNKWNLLIKKHPSEHDYIVDEAVNKNKFPQQKVFEHMDLALNDAIRYADIVSCQSSSIVLEAMVYSKPFCFLTKNAAMNMTNFNVLAKESFVKVLDPITDFETFVHDMQNPLNKKAFIEKLESAKERYLYKVDGQASQRLINLLLTLVNKH